MKYCRKEPKVNSSIIIPVYDPDNKLEEMTNKCIKSVKENIKGTYEIIVVRCNYGGFPSNVNKGWAASTGRFIFTINNDFIVKDNLNKLASGKYIMSWQLNPFYLDKKLVPDGACWCMPREIFLNVGFLDERFDDGYGFEDSDYWWRARELGYDWIDGQLKGKHKESKTFHTYYKNRDELLRKNEILFKEKWG